MPVCVIYIEARPILSAPFTQRFEAKVEVALVPVPFTSMNPAKVEVAVVLVAVKYPARALVPRSEEPFTERVRQGLVVPMPMEPVESVAPVPFRPVP